MRTLGYTSCKADPDLRYKSMVIPGDGFKYYAYVLLYVDDYLCIHHGAISAIREIDKYFPMKQGSIGDPVYTYLRTVPNNALHGKVLINSRSAEIAS